MGDPWYRTPARYVRRPHPAQSTTPASPLKHPSMLSTPPPPSHAKTSRRWIFAAFWVVFPRLPPPSQAGIVLDAYVLFLPRRRAFSPPREQQVTFRHRPRLHLPCVPDDEGFIIYQDIGVHARTPRLLFIPNFQPRKTARQCQLTLALHLRGLLVGFGKIPVDGSGYTWVFENPYPSLSKPAPLGADVGFRRYGTP